MFVRSSVTNPIILKTIKKISAFCVFFLPQISKNMEQLKLERKIRQQAKNFNINNVHQKHIKKTKNNKHKNNNHPAPKRSLELPKAPKPKVTQQTIMARLIKKSSLAVASSAPCISFLCLYVCVLFPYFFLFFFCEIARKGVDERVTFFLCMYL